MLKTDKRQFLATSLLTIALLSMGFALLHFDLIGYGNTLFLLVPFCIGFLHGQRPTWKSSLFFALLIGMVIFCYLLITAQLEGIFCVIVLSPLIFVLVFVGAILGYAIRQKLNKPNKEKRINLGIYPLVILLFSGTIEHFFTERYGYGKVESKIYLPFDHEKVFDYIKSVDTLDTKKPFLMKLGLPVPQKCVLDKESVGARRICYFEEGTIDEVVTEIKHGEILKMNVTNYGLPGRKWLKFQEAIYLFEKKDTGTVLTRITTYRTELKPRFYWKFWEVRAIEAEHEYVLKDLERRLN